MEPKSGDVLRRFAGGVVVVVLTQVARRAISFVGNLYLLKLVTPQAIGIFAILQFVVLQLTTYSGAALNQAMIKEGRAAGSKAQSALFTLQMTAAVILCVIVLALIGPISRYYDHPAEIRRYLPAFLAVVPILILKHYLSAVREIALDFKRIAFAETLEQTLYLITAIASCYWLGPLPALVLGFGLARAASAGYLLACLEDLSALRPSFRWRELRPYLHFGSYFQLGTFCNTIRDAMLPVVLGRMAGTEALGEVTWALRMAVLPVFHLSFLDGIAFASFCRLRDQGPSGESEYRWLLGQLCRVTSMATGAYLLVLNLFMPELLHSFFGMQWEHASRLVPYFSVNIFFFASAMPIIQSLYAWGKVRLIFLQSLFTVIYFWTAGTALVRWLGPAGYAWAELLFTVNHALYFWLAWKLGGLRPSESFQFPLLSGAAAAAVFAGLSLVHVPGPAWLLARIALVGGVFVALNYRLWVREFVHHAREAGLLRRPARAGSSAEAQASVG